MPWRRDDPKIASCGMWTDSTEDEAMNAFDAELAVRSLVGICKGPDCWAMGFRAGRERR
jgi:hypothetical protein